MSNSQGFTLIEILIVISIIVILGGVGLESLRSIQPSLELNSVSRDLITDIRYAQELAVAEQTVHGMCFFISENKYNVVRYGTVEETIIEKNLPSAISFQEINGFSGDCLKFNPYGSVWESGNVILINSKGETKNIEIKPSGFSKFI
ncbi:MAG: GspH/FimT family protein [Patescibacteria group bacterium]